MRNLIVATGLLALSSSCLAYDYPQAVNNLTEDFATCATYYNFVYSLAVSAKWEKEQVAYKKARDDAVDWVHGLMKDKPPGWELSKLELKQKMMEVEFAQTGMDGLHLAYLDMCKLAMNDYKTRLQYWLDKPSQSK